MLVWWRGKRAYAHRDAILVDYMQRNVDDWRDAGGFGIHHTLPASTLMVLEACLFC